MADKIQAYEMELVFTGSLGMKDVNDLLRYCGCEETYLIKNALKIKIKQTLLKIPDEAYLEQIARILEENYETKQFTLMDCRFTGYKYIREVEVDSVE